ncbi:hypothetical protein F750_4340 [Streptomyces sp. PAMC 26508]|nr:hypothetical protein F750_4340 [Streptomyces sp. PAMC 26508]
MHRGWYGTGSGTGRRAGRPCPPLDSVRAPRLQPPPVDNTRPTRVTECDI